MTIALTGHAVARGIAICQTHLVERNELEIGEYHIQPEDADNEVRRFRDALSLASEPFVEKVRRRSRDRR